MTAEIAYAFGAEFLKPVALPDLTVSLAACIAWYLEQQSITNTVLQSLGLLRV